MVTTTELVEALRALVEGTGSDRAPDYVTWSRASDVLTRLDEQSMNNVRMGRSILLGLAKKSGRCTFHDDVDAKDNPIGEPCGCPAVKLLIWHDGSFSLACAKHTENVLSDEARELLRDVVHIGKASL